MTSKRCLLRDVEVIRNFLLEVELSSEYRDKGGVDKLIEASKSIGNLGAMLSFQKVMLESISKEAKDMYVDIVGDGLALSNYEQEKIYD
jgi:hypothetical protein